MHFNAFFIVFATLAFVGQQTLACQTAIDSPNVCLYGSNILEGAGSGDADRLACSAVNENPFVYAASPGTSGVSASQCEADARADGSACVQFYAKYACASNCQLCNLGPCSYFCSNYATICPTATASQCFKSISCASGNSAGDTCTQWSIDSSKIPASTATTTKTTKTTTTTPRSTTSGTGTGTDTDQFTSNAPIFNTADVKVIFSMAVFAVCFIFFG